jgi:hypothetical protein
MGYLSSSICFVLQLLAACDIQLPVDYTFVVWCSGDWPAVDAAGGVLWHAVVCC